MIRGSDPRAHLGSFPPWFTQVDSEPEWQKSLFTQKRDDVLAALRVSPDELRRWHEQGWTSFGPDFDDELDEPQLNEVRFVRDVVRSGVTDALLVALLAELPKPFNFDPLRVAYSFSLGWVQAVIPEEPDVDSLIENHLDDWLARVGKGDIQRLGQLRERLNELMAAAEE